MNFLICFHHLGGIRVLKKKYSASQFWNDCRKHNVRVLVHQRILLLPLQPIKCKFLFANAPLTYRKSKTHRFTHFQRYSIFNVWYFFFACIQNLGLVFLWFNNSNQVFISKCSGYTEISIAGWDSYSHTITKIAL